MNSKYHWGANWGWIACRTAVMKEAVRAFTLGEDEKAQMLRHLAGTTLVLQEDTLKDAPFEHCAPGCDMHAGVYNAMGQKLD